MYSSQNHFHKTINRIKCKRPVVVYLLALMFGQPIEEPIKEEIQEEDILLIYYIRCPPKYNNSG